MHFLKHGVDVVAATASITYAECLKSLPSHETKSRAHEVTTASDYKNILDTAMERILLHTQNALFNLLTPNILSTSVRFVLLSTLMADADSSRTSYRTTFSGVNVCSHARFSKFKLKWTQIIIGRRETNSDYTRLAVFNTGKFVTGRIG